MMLQVSMIRPSYAACEMLTEPLAKVVCELKDKAGNGLVRIVAKVRSGLLGAGPTSSQDRQAAEADAQDTLVRKMRDQGAVLVEPIKGQPLVVMEVNAEQLDRLVETGLVESIQEDKIEEGFSK